MLRRQYYDPSRRRSSRNDNGSINGGEHTQGAGQQRDRATFLTCINYKLS